MTDLTTIYRVEDDRGRGLYGSYTCDQTEENESIWIKAIPVKDLWDHKNHVQPYNDGLKDMPSGYKYGYKSLEQLKEWIFKPEWRTSLHEKGGVIKKIQLPVGCVLFGGHQIAYDPKQVADIKDVSLLDI